MPTETETESERKFKQTNQMFNFSERPIMNYVCDFLNKPCIELFVDNIPESSEPLILLPIDDYKKNVYIKFTLKTVHPSKCDEYKTNELSRISKITNLIQYDKFKESIGFILYCIKTTYPSIIASGMCDNSSMINTFLELNEANWSLMPIFNSDLTIKKKILEDTLSKIMHMKQNHTDCDLSDSVEMDTQLTNVISKLTDVNNAITPEILGTELEITNSYFKKPFIGIFVEELSKSELPNKNNKSNKNDSKLQSISDITYSDSIN
jgi:hypothetical protein